MKFRYNNFVEYYCRVENIADYMTLACKSGALRLHPLNPKLFRLSSILEFHRRYNCNKNINPVKLKVMFTATSVFRWKINSCREWISVAHWQEYTVLKCHVHVFPSQKVFCMSGRVEAGAVTNLIQNTWSRKIPKTSKLLLTLVNSTACLVDERESGFPDGYRYKQTSALWRINTQHPCHH